MILNNTFEQYQAGQGANTGAGIGAAAGASKGAGGATVTAGVLSALSDIAVGYINAGRIKQTAKFNSTMGEIQTRIAGIGAKYNIARIRAKANSIFSSQRASYAKRGVTLDGSPAEVMTKSLKESELDAFMVQIEADFAGYNVSAQNKINENEASSAYGVAGLNAAKTILQSGVKQYTRG